jgi:hypothetical protein
MNIFKKIVLSISLLAMPLTVLAIQTASAGPFDASKREVCRGATLGSSSNCNSGRARNQLEDTIQFAVNLLTMIVGIAAVIMIIVNGLKYISSGGDSNAVSSAKSGITYAIVGLIIVALAQVIVRYVISNTD